MTPRRSALFMPAHNERAISKARTLDCDVVILDLEDAVAPDTKKTARETAKASVTEGGFDPQKSRFASMVSGATGTRMIFKHLSMRPWMRSWSPRPSYQPTSTG